jgi:chromosome partitioning protein
MRTNTTLVINPKGGSGKTTVATNLASYFAANGIATTVMDYDAQGSTMNWLRVRPLHARKIHGANAAPQKTGLRTLGMHVPADTQQLIIDAPAGASGLALQEMLSRAHASSSGGAVCDRHPRHGEFHPRPAADREDPRQQHPARRRREPGAQVEPSTSRSSASSSRSTAAAHARLSDSDVFLTAAEAGVGIFEMDFAVSAAERSQFLPIAEWVEQLPVATATRPVPLVATAARPGLRVISGTLSHPSFR